MKRKAKGDPKNELEEDHQRKGRVENGIVSGESAVQEARELLSLAEAMCGASRDGEEGDLERMVFRLDGNGGLLVSKIDQPGISHLSGSQTMDNGQNGECIEEQRTEMNQEVNQPQLPDPPSPSGPKEDPSSSRVQQRTLDLKSPPFDPKNWPADAHARCHMYSRPNCLEESHLIPHETTRVVYLSITSHRMEGNVAFSMALWLSETLGIDLDVLVSPFPSLS
jgi:hypothetical protein